MRTVLPPPDRPLRRPSASNDRTYRGFVEFANQELGFLFPEEKRWVFGETALRLWPMLRA
jgi:hypothetical protein